MRCRTPRFDPKKLLIVLHGSIGDVTRALPLAHLLRRGFPQTFLAWSIEPACFPLLEGNPWVDEILVFDRNRGWKAFLPFLTEVRSRKFDLVLDLQRHLKSGIVSWYTGAPLRLGFNRTDCKEMNWVFNNLHIPAYGDDIPKLDHYLKFAEFLEIERTPIEWCFALSAEERVAVDRYLSPVSSRFAVLFVGSRWESKRWFPAQIARCAERMQAEHQLDVVLLGGKADQTIANEAMLEARTRMTNLVGSTSLREAVGIITRAIVAVGPDTGLMHVAAAVKTPVISIWGATSPARNGPFGFGEYIVQGVAPCVPCNRKRCDIGRACLQSITEEQISAKIRIALERERTNQAGHVTYG